jgi:DNA-binding XRE family transcriptional regulator
VNLDTGTDDVMPKRNQPVDVFKQINMGGGDTSICWEWTGKLNKKDGRPYFTVAGKRRPAYAIVLTLFTGEEGKNKSVLHSCDNPICCNPHHLSWGTHQRNMDDMKERDRHGLPRIVIRAIRKLLSEGKTQKEIADLYGVSREAVSAISTGRNHRKSQEGA